MHARAVFREKKRYYEGILRNMLARPPGHPMGSEKDEHQVLFDQVDQSSVGIVETIIKLRKSGVSKK